MRALSPGASRLACWRLACSPWRSAAESAANPRFWPTAPALRLLRLADGLFLRWRQGLRRPTAASSAPNGFPIRPQLLFPACQGIIDALRPCSSPVERAHPDPPRSCARASGLHVRLLGFLSLLGASPALVVRPWFPRLVPLLVVPRSNRLLSLSLWFFRSLRWPTPPPTRPPCRVHEGGAWRACRRRLLLLSLLLRPCLLGRWPLLFFGRRGSPAGRPRAFVRQRLARLPLPSISAGRLGGERRIAPRQTLQQMPPDAAERIPRTGIRAMIPGSRREWVGRQIRLYTKICVQKAPAQLKPHRGRARADRMGNPVRKTGAKRIKSPEMPSNCARPDQRRAKRGIPNPKRPADRPKIGCQMSSRRRSARYASVLPPLAA